MPVGVYPNKGRFEAFIGHAGKRHFLGGFFTEAEAVEAYNFAKEQLAGGSMELRKPVGQRLPVAAIRTDGNTQTRVAVDDVVVDEYVTLLKEPLDDGSDFEFPAIVVFKDAAGEYWNADGFHRCAAYKKAGREHIPAKVRDGGRREALLYALGANEDHGLRRSPADKRRSVEICLADPEWSQWSDREIMRRCKVSFVVVKGVKDQLASVRASSGVSPAAAEEEPKVTYSRGGKTGTMRTGNIGKGKQPAAAEESPAKEDDACKDDEGNPVPEHLLSVFVSVKDFDDCSQKLKEVAAFLNRMRDHPAGSLLKEDQQRCHELHKNLSKAVTFARPHCVCPDCNGTKKTCQVCKGRFFLNEEAARVYKRSKGSAA